MNKAEPQVIESQNGIFGHVQNSCSFVDLVKIAVRGVRRKRVEEAIVVESTPAIGGRGRVYARCVRAHHLISGNPLQLAYGLMRKFSHVSPFSLTVWSDSAPVTCAEVQLVLDGFFRRGYRADVSSAEITFDVARLPYWLATRDLCTRARTLHEISDGNGKRTTYAGSSRSPWQMRIYQKTPGLLRIEFVVRSRFLRKHAIREPQSLYLVKRVPLFDCVGFRFFGPSRSLTLSDKNVQQTFGLVLRTSVPGSWVETMLRKEGVDPRPWLRRSELENTLRKMLANFIW
jgi:hypothetical protein